MEKIQGLYIPPPIGNDSYITDNTSSMVKDQINMIIQNIPVFAEGINAVKSYSDFERIKNEINDFFMQMFANMLDGKSADFVLGFEQSNISNFQTKHELDKLELMKLLVLKNRFYNEILRSIVSFGKLDVILGSDGREDLLNMIESGVFSFLDEIYVEWYKNIYNGENQGITNDILVYGGVKNGKIVDLASLSDKEIIIDDDKLAKIHNVNIRAYLLSFSQFIKEGTTDYAAWVGAELSEMKSWQDRGNIFGLVAPMEDYIYPQLLIEPELIIFLRDLDKKVNFEDFYGLSEEYFGNRYGMDHMTLDFVESILQTGDASFCGFIGKAFPNDNELSKQEGNCIILKNGKMKDVVKNAKKGLKALFGEDFLIDDEKLYQELIKEVTYHEFGHSLFIKGHSSSLLEEAKATFFYYLQIHKEHSIEAYDTSDITRIVEFTIMDSIRNLERINDSSSRKYVVLTKLNLSFLYSSRLIRWEDDILIMNANKDSFDSFLFAMKNMLYYIESNYYLSEKAMRREEDIFLANLEAQIQDNIARMIRKLA